MKNNQILDKVFKHFYGISGPLDEYKLSIINRIGNVCFIILSTFLLVSNFIAIVLSQYYPEAVAFGYPAILTVLILILFSYIIYQGRVHELSKVDEEELTSKEKSELPNVGFKAGLRFGIGMFLLMPLLEGNYLDTLFSTRNIVTSIIQGIFFGIFMQVVIMLRVRKNNQ